MLAGAYECNGRNVRTGRNDSNNDHLSRTIEGHEGSRSLSQGLEIEELEVPPEEEDEHANRANACVAASKPLAGKWL